MNNQSTNDVTNNAQSRAAGPSWGTKAGYIGAGVVIGLIAYPFVRKLIAQVQPRMDQLLDNLTGKAEGVAEKASDLFAKAKSSLSHSEVAPGSNGHGHAHSHAEEA